MTGVLEKSINTGTVFAEEKLGHELFLKCLDNFGFFQPTGIGLGEIYSENKELKKGYEINFATASFGQGIEVTPVQLISAFAAIANNGKKFEPRLINKIINEEDEEDKILKGNQKEIISSKAAGELVNMLVSVVENGFAQSAQIPGYYVAGKTGTAQMSLSSLSEGSSGYSNKTWQSFIGFAPAFNPRFVILVKLDNPEAKTAEYSALPIFRNLAKYILDYYQILPSY
jgi:cell division protein FtsI/penicillin-binding protein 2